MEAWAWTLCPLSIAIQARAPAPKPPPTLHLSIPPSPPPQSLLPHTPVMCRYTLGWLLFHDRLLLPGAETHLIVNIWAITIAN